MGPGEAGPDGVGRDDELRCNLWCCLGIEEAMRVVLIVVSLTAFCVARVPAQGAQSCSSLPLATFSYDRALPLDLRDSVTRTQDGVEIHAISFASPRGGRATGLLFLPEQRLPEVRLPGIVMQHGMPGKAEYVSWVSGNIAHHGAIVVALDAPFARRAGDPVTFTPQDSAEQVQLIVDLQRAFDLLTARPDVDAGRLAFVGRSYGAAMGGLLASVEHRPRTYVLIVGDGGLVTHYSAPGRRAALDTLSPERRERWLAAMRPIEPIRYIDCAQGTSFFFQAARKDELVTLNDAVAFQRAAPKPVEVRWYDLDHNLGWPAIMDELEWLHRTLGTAPAGAKADMWCATKERCPE